MMLRPVSSVGRRWIVPSSSALPFCLLFGLLPAKIEGQSCLGSSPDPNAAEFSLLFRQQHQGQRVGGRASANIAGVLGVEAGVAGGKIDPFAVNGTEIGGLLWLSPFRASPASCFFTEVETSEEDIRGAFELDRGKYRERWIRFGLGFGVPLGTTGGMGFSVHVAPEVISRRSNLKGRALYSDTAVYVLETEKQVISMHLGGRSVLSARHDRMSVILFLRTRPRVGEDLQWGAQIGFPI